MGQLRALKHLQANGQSLLSQVKALSTVSGGSWVGVTFEFLTETTSDDAYLNEYVANPHDLVPSDGLTPAVTLDTLPEGNIGHFCTSRLFSVPALAVEAFLLWKLVKTPPEMLWQTLMGLHILKGYGLHESGDQDLPLSFFSLDAATLEGIRNENPSLGNETCHLLATGPGRTPRAWPVCNTALFVTTLNSIGSESLAPVQATPIFTGVVGTPDGQDTNGRQPGGGGVTSFAFNSNLTEIDGDQVKVGQTRQWSLTDIVGSSSAAFAEDLQKIVKDPEKLLKHLEEHSDDILDWLKSHFGGHVSQRLHEKLKSRPRSTGLFSRLANRFFSGARRRLLQALLDDLDDLGDIIPAYDYWPVRDSSPNPSVKPTRFADGGNLENTGIASLLAYDDIDSVIAFVNCPNPMKAGSHGVIDQHSQEVPNTRVVVDGQIPPLFGYQPYDEQRGYIQFPADSEDVMRNNQVFPSEAFPELLQGLWKATGNEASPGSNAHPAVFRQTLQTQKNDWFGVAGDKSVTVLWNYLNPVNDWTSALRPEVQDLVAETNHFPNTPTLETHLTATQVNLLSSQTAWCVANPENAEKFTALFATEG